MPLPTLDAIWLGLLKVQVVDEDRAEAARAIEAARERIRANTILRDVVVVTPDDGNRSGKRTLACRLDIHPHAKR